MKYLPILLITIIITSCTAPTDPINDSSWLQGTWEREFNGNTQIETWVVNDDTLIGISSFVNGVDTTMMILNTIYKGNREWTLLSEDKGVEFETIYSLISHSKDSLEFYNPHNGWPATIIYRKTDENNLEIKLNGYNSGTNKSISFTYKKK